MLEHVPAISLSARRQPSSARTTTVVHLPLNAIRARLDPRIEPISYP
jgi:hypothetical protein